jgi:RNase P/RNase MRP subunit POP5
MKPTERFKQRYVSFELRVGGAPPSSGRAKSIIHEHVLSMFGELGVSSLAFKLVKYGESDGRGVVRCERSHVREMVFCMACLSVVEKEEGRMVPLSTSGTIKGLN